jgi:antitoxin Phd
MLTVTSVEAQNRFGQLLDTVQREPITIIRHGRTAAFIVSPRDMEAWFKGDVSNQVVAEIEAYFAANPSESLQKAARSQKEMAEIARAFR